MDCAESMQRVATIPGNESPWPERVDVLVVGGSPALLARASYCAASQPDRRVMVIDAGDTIGGSWRLCSPFKNDSRRYDSFEHLLAGGPVTRGILRRSGIRLQQRPLLWHVRGGLSATEKEFLAGLFPFDPESRTDGDNPILPHTEGGLLKRLRGNEIRPQDIEDFKRKVHSTQTLEMYRSQTVNTYLETNMDEILGRIGRGLERHGVDLRLGHTVEVVDARDPRRLHVTGSFGQLEAQRVILGKYFSGRVIGPDGEVTIQKAAFKRRTVIIRLKSEAEQPYTYVKLLGWPRTASFQRVYADRPDPQGTTTFCIHMRDPRVHDGETLEIAQSTIDDLIAYGIVNQDSQVISAHLLNLDFIQGAEKASEAIRHCSAGRIEMLAFTNLGHEIGKHPAIWDVALGSAGAPSEIGQATPTGSSWSNMLTALRKRARKLYASSS